MNISWSGFNDDETSQASGQANTIAPAIITR